MLCYQHLTSNKQTTFLFTSLCETRHCAQTWPIPSHPGRCVGVYLQCSCVPARMAWASLCMCALATSCAHARPPGWSGWAEVMQARPLLFPGQLQGPNLTISRVISVPRALSLTPLV